ncbi:hypothetical protein T06_136 [Trichinella sp. T6]|nr:hypothetical protein T06_136 [Trichinella sp. T6]
MTEMEEQNYSVSEHRVGSTEELPNGYSGHIVILTAKKDLRAPSLAPEDFEELRRITFPVLQRA